MFRAAGLADGACKAAVASENNGGQARSAQRDFLIVDGIASGSGLFQFREQEILSQYGFGGERNQFGSIEIGFDF